MNPSDFSSRLIPLSTGHPGLRSTLTVGVREPSKNEVGTLSTASPSCVLNFISSDESVDRYNEIISAAGWKLDNYRRNPVFQNAHQTGDILHTLGRALVTEVRQVGRDVPIAPSGLCLFQTIEFACDVNPMARIAYGLYKGQFLNAVSVGFVPLRWENGTEKSGYARKFVEQELLEVSAVAIPANPNALALGLKSGAVEKSDLKDVVEIFRSALADAPQSPGPRPVPGRSNTQTEAGAQMLQLLTEFHRLIKS